MNSNMETKELDVYDQRDRGIPLIKFTTMDSSQISQLGSILSFCREHQLPPPEQYAMYGSVDDTIMNVAVPDVMYDEVYRLNPTMEVYALLCKEFGAENVDKLVLKDHKVVYQRVLSILSHAADNVFKTEELEVAIQFSMTSGNPVTLIDEIILDCLQQNYDVERVRRVYEFFHHPTISYKIYHIRKARKET